uniref:Centromere protein Q n=1 Tax=Nothobranchius furzeri TaxID=105023 RepID=A0A8C6LDJ5_NOTFU
NMKPVRGSNRASSQAPSRNKSRKKAQVKSNEEVKGQDKWKVLPPSSICAMENIMDLSILTTLTMKRKDKVSQEHLNLLKNRFLAHCTQLKAPVQKHARLVYSSQQHREETRKLAAGKLTLRSLKVLLICRWDPRLGSLPGLGSFCMEFACSPCACVGSLPVLQ